MEVRIVRSAGRTKTVSIREKDGQLEVRAPARMSDADLAPIVDRLTARLQRRKDRGVSDEGDLERLGQELNQRYFGGLLTWHSIRWADNQTTRWGSCTPATGTIRLSRRLATMPAWVRDYVVVHELAHLLEPNHGPRFWALVNRYPRTERARGYLMAVGGEAGDEEM